MPRLPTIRVIGSHAISTSCPGSRFTCDGSGMVVVIELLSLLISCATKRFVRLRRGSPCAPKRLTYQVRVAPVSSFVPGCRHRGSLSTVRPVTCRSPRMTEPYSPDTVEETCAPGGSSMNGMNLSGNPGMVQPMQIPPTFGQPPTPLIQPRFGPLHFTTGPQQPSLTRHCGEPCSVANWPCS